MKTIKYFSYLLLASLFLFSCGTGAADSEYEEESTSRLDDASPKKCDGKQAYVKYTFEGESTQEIPLDKINTADIFSEYSSLGKSSTFIADFDESQNVAALMVSSNGYNLEKGSYTFTKEKETEGNILFTIESGPKRGIYTSADGTLKLDAWNYIESGRKENQRKDFGKGVYTGNFTNTLEFGATTTYRIKIEFCLCGSIGI